MSVKRKCVCCGKEYDYCPSCPKNDQPGWMVTFCSEPCKDLFNIISAFNSRRIGKDAVNKYMAEHNIDSNKYVGSVKEVLDSAKEVEKKADVTPSVKPSQVAPKIEKKISQLAKETKTTPDANYDYRSRRNKKRRNRQLDIELS